MIVQLNLHCNFSMFINDLNSEPIEIIHILWHYICSYNAIHMIYDSLNKINIDINQ